MRTLAIRSPALQPDSIEHGIGFLGIKIPSANRRFLERNNWARKSHADLGHISLPGNHLITPIQKMPQSIVSVKVIIAENSNWPPCRVLHEFPKGQQDCTVGDTCTEHRSYIKMSLCQSPLYQIFKCVIYLNKINIFL